jgi:tetratricopeptide (TPR) repeat protein
MIAKLRKQLAALVTILVIVGVALAQQGAVKGTVKSRSSQNDAPKIVEGAVIDIVRLDINQKFQAKTDKKGEFFHSLPAFGDYVVSVSGPNFSPVTSGKFKVSGDLPIEQNFELVPGDGRRLSTEEIRDAGKQGGSSAIAAASGKKPSAEEIAKLEEDRKRITEKNKKVEDDFKAVKQHFEAGMAFDKKNDYENAIKEYTAAVAIDDAQPGILAQLAQSCYNLGAVKFNAKQNDVARDLFKRAADTGERASKLEPNNTGIIKLYADACDILFKQFKSSEHADKAIAAYNTGAGIETDKAKKTAMLNKIASIYFSRGEIDQSATAYDKVLAEDAENLEALKGKASIILATTVTNTTPEDKARLEQAMNIFQSVVDKLPADSSSRKEVEGYIAYLQDTMKIEVKKESSKPNRKEDKKEDKKDKKKK